MCKSTFGRWRLAEGRGGLRQVKQRCCAFCGAARAAAARSGGTPSLGAGLPSSFATSTDGLANFILPPVEGETLTLSSAALRGRLTIARCVPASAYGAAASQRGCAAGAHVTAASRTHAGASREALTPRGASSRDIGRPLPSRCAEYMIEAAAAPRHPTQCRRRCMADKNTPLSGVLSGWEAPHAAVGNSCSGKDCTQCPASRLQRRRAVAHAVTAARAC